MWLWPKKKKNGVWETLRTSLLPGAWHLVPVKGSGDSCRRRTCLACLLLDFCSRQWKHLGQVDAFRGSKCSALVGPSQNVLETRDSSQWPVVRARRAKEDHDSSGRLPGGGGPGVTPARTAQLRNLQGGCGHEDDELWLEGPEGPCSNPGSAPSHYVTLGK